MPKEKENSSESSKASLDHVTFTEKNSPEKPIELTSGTSSSSSEDEADNDDWQFYGKDFLEPGEDPRSKSVRYEIF